MYGPWLADWGIILYPHDSRLGSAREELGGERSWARIMSSQRFSLVDDLHWYSLVHTHTQMVYIYIYHSAHIYIYIHTCIHTYICNSTYVYYTYIYIHHISSICLLCLPCVYVCIYIYVCVCLSKGKRGFCFIAPCCFFGPWSLSNWLWEALNTGRINRRSTALSV